jgi:anti-sigma factor ChrR (cupin superfamily)
MATDDFTDRLSDYLDDELSTGERAVMGAHLASCDACRSTLDALRAVVSQARQLRDSPPEHELWSGVAARIAPAERPGARRSAFRRIVSSRLSVTMPQLAAAGLALMVLSGGLVWMARSGDPRADFPRVSADTELRAPAAPPAPFADPHYEDAVAELERALKTAQARLDVATVRVLDENLAAIDQAIEQSARALATDPGNVYLSRHLADVRQRKLTLLLRATALAMLEH